MSASWIVQAAECERVEVERAATRIAHLLKDGEGMSRQQLAEKLGMHVDDVMAGILRLDARGLMIFSSGLNRWFLRDRERLENAAHNAQD